MSSPARSRVLVATVTPLASIFGSGFLIIVPVLERTLGGLAVVGAAGVCAVAWLVGTAVRHRVRVVEPLAASGALDPATRRLDRLADAVIVVAYVISVALYLRIMAEYVVTFAVDGGSLFAVRTLACAAVALIDDGRALLDVGLRLPPVPDAGVGRVLVVLGGILITVQGFETIRYLGDEYDARTRIWASAPRRGPMTRCCR